VRGSRGRERAAFRSRRRQHAADALHASPTTKALSLPSALRLSGSSEIRSADAQGVRRLRARSQSSCEMSVKRLASGDRLVGAGGTVPDGHGSPRAAIRRESPGLNCRSTASPHRRPLASTARSTATTAGLSADRADSVVGGAIAITLAGSWTPDTFVSGQGVREGV
jgi:hypothetical protein